MAFRFSLRKAEPVTTLGPQTVGTCGPGDWQFQLEPRFLCKPHDVRESRLPERRDG